MYEEPENPLSDPRIGVTTVEPVADKASVAAYQVSPVVELGEGVLGCEFCGYTRFRRSRVRFPDMFEVLRLRFPMRCMRCSQRQYQDVTLAFLCAPAKNRSPRLAEGTDTWQQWTRSTPETPLSTRPMSTAVGTRAQRLSRPTTPAAPTPAPTATSTTGRVQGRRTGDGEIW